MSLYGNILLDENYIRYISEAYFGKLPFLLEVEKALHELRQPKYLGKLNDIDSCAPVQRINRLMEQGFGMDVFALQIDKSEYVDAYTKKIAIKYDVALDMEIEKLVTASPSTGYRFIPNNNLCLIVTLSLGLLKYDFTDAEIVAIMLHEIGHNFADAIHEGIRIDNKDLVNLMYKYTIDIVIMTIVDQHKPFTALKILRNWSKKKNTSKYLVKKNRNIRFNPLRGIGKAIGAKCTDFKDFCKGVVKRYFKYGDLEQQLKLAKIYGIDKKARASLDRQDEVLADKFAGIYGYGPEQGSALLKLDNIESKSARFVNRLPGGKKKNEKYDKLLIGINKYDEHPHTIQRINEEINVLKYELNKGCDPKYEAVIKEQISQLEDLLHDATIVVKSFNSNQKARAKFNAYINQEEPDAVDKEIEDELNAAFDILL